MRGFWFLLGTVLFLCPQSRGNSRATISLLWKFPRQVIQRLRLQKRIYKIAKHDSALSLKPEQQKTRLEIFVCDQLDNVDLFGAVYVGKNGIHINKDHLRNDSYPSLIHTVYHEYFHIRHGDVTRSFLPCSGNCPVDKTAKKRSYCKECFSKGYGFFRREYLAEYEATIKMFEDGYRLRSFLKNGFVAMGPISNIECGTRPYYCGQADALYELSKRYPDNEEVKQFVILLIHNGFFSSKEVFKEDIIFDRFARYGNSLWPL